MSLNLPGLLQQIAHFEARLRTDPDSRAFLPLSDLYRRAGQLVQARDLLRRGLARDPDCVSARVLLGQVLAELRETPAADRELEAVLARDPDNLVALKLLGRAAAERGDWARARELLERLVRLLPEAAEVREALREARQRVGEAPASPQAAAAAAPPPGPAAEAPSAELAAPGAGLATPTLADLYRRQGHTAKAREILARILAAEPGRADALAVLARLDETDAQPPIDPGGAPEGPAERTLGRPAAAGGVREADLQRFRHWLDGAAEGGDHSR
jgi:tetratricopeptide (TPR) repeat protein